MQQKFKCLIVDDEPIARQIVEIYCGHLPDMEVVASCDNALEAKYVLQKGGIDILFLDINMPVLDGISFLKTLRQPPVIIFTTAYKEYALDAFDLAACDYLLKPFSLERFLIAVDKAKERVKPAANTVVVKEVEAETEAFTFIRSEGKIYKILFADLLYVEARGNQIKLVLDKNTLLSTMTFSAFEALLPKSFLRLHRSFLVNKAKISHIEGNRVYVGETAIPVGANYREGFLREIGI